MPELMTSPAELLELDATLLIELLADVLEPGTEVEAALELPVDEALELGTVELIISPAELLADALESVDEACEEVTEVDELADEALEPGTELDAVLLVESVDEPTELATEVDELADEALEPVPEVDEPAPEVAGSAW